MMTVVHAGNAVGLPRPTPRATVDEWLAAAAAMLLVKCTGSTVPSAPIAASAPPPGTMGSAGRSAPPGEGSVS
jgi:hypothetical protein